MNGAERLKQVLRKLWPPRNFRPAEVPPLDVDWQRAIEGRLARLEARQNLNRALLVAITAAFLREVFPYLRDVLSK